jgi:enterochelin esterase family protein
MKILTRRAHWLALCGIVPVTLVFIPTALRGQQPPAAAPAAAPAVTPAAPGPRAANAPPLVPLTAARDGNFRIAPPYVDDPAFTEKPDVPKGRVIRFTMNSADSKIFPTAPPARAGGGGRGAAAGANAPPAAPPVPAVPPAPPATFDRQIAVYVPAGYVPNTPAPFMVVQDERWYVKEDAPDGRTDLAFMPTMLDNLIHEKRVPPMVAVLLWPGPGGQRSIEYDTISDRYMNFIETEVLPRITRDYQVAFTTDPGGRATFGESSGSPAALAMAWLYPNLYTRVISYSGTFVALQRNAVAPNGGWDFHKTLIPNSAPKPIRIWMEVGENDNGSTTSEEGMRNWVLANNHMADALKAKGYHYQYVFAEGVAHVSRPVQKQTMPEAFEWVWQGYKAK